MIKWIPYLPKHLAALEVAGHAPCIGGNSLAYAEALYEPEMSFSFEDDNGVILGCGGIKRLWEGVGSSWSMFSPELKKHRFFLTRTSKRKIEFLAETQRLHRVELIVAEGFQAGKAWARAIGFTSEGIRHKYTPDKQNIEMFVRLF